MYISYHLHEFGLKGLSLPAVKQDYRWHSNVVTVWRLSLRRCLLSGDSTATALLNEKAIALPRRLLLFCKRQMVPLFLSCITQYCHSEPMIVKVSHLSFHFSWCFLEIWAYVGKRFSESFDILTITLVAYLMSFFCLE